MKITYKILYSVAPTITLILIYLLVFDNYDTVQGWHVFTANALLLVQTIFLYKEMARLEFSTESKIVYTVLLVIFLPFHFILIWGLLKKK